MRLAIAGGTGVIGRLVVEEATTAGHDVTVISRSTGVDLRAGTGLESAVDGADAVIDVANVNTLNRAKAIAFFETATRNLLAAERVVGVRHHVALSIVGIDRVPNGYYQGKLRQEDVIAGGEIPWTVLRATQFHEFPVQLLARVKGPIVPVPRMRSATVAAREVAGQLVDLATAPPRGHAGDMAGPEVHDMADLVRQVVRAQRRRRVVLPVRVPGALGAAMRGDGHLPSGGATTGRQTFDEWLAAFAG